MVTAEHVTTISDKFQLLWVFGRSGGPSRGIIYDVMRGTCTSWKLYRNRNSLKCDIGV